MKRTLTLLLALLMVAALLAGCTGGENTPANTASANTGSNGNGAVDAAQAGVWPIVTDGSVTLTIWRPIGGDAAPFTSDWADGSNYSYNELMKNTGIKLDFIMPPQANAAEQFQVMVLSDDHPDVVANAQLMYTGGGDKAIEDGFIINLRPFVETLAPNYMRYVNMNETQRRNSYTDEGNLVGFYQFYDRPQPSFMGYGVRGDWLDQMGMARPETIDEWHTMLVAFRDQYGCNGPMELYKTGVPMSNFFVGAYGATTNTADGFICKDGKIEYSPISDGFRSYLELMHSWYAEGLVDPDFLSNGESDFYPNNTRAANNQDAAFHMQYVSAGTFLADSGVLEPGANVVLVKAPKVNRGDTLLVGGKGVTPPAMVPLSYCVTAQCAIPEIATRFFDYYYTDEGMIITNYGIEGVTYEKLPDGTLHHLDLIANNPDGMTTNVAQDVYLIHNGASVFMLDREENAQNDTALEYRELWSEGGIYNIDASLTYSAEEGSERSAVLGDAKTLVEEFTCNVIMGNTELNDSTWQTFVSQIERMGIDRATAITQAAYDRYLAR